MAMSAAPPLPDWSELQRDPLSLIIRSLELRDALSAAAVCTGWRTTAAAALGRALTPNRVPIWLLLAMGTTRKRSSGGTIGSLLHDVFSGRSYRTTIPSSPVIGCSHGWFLFYGHRDDKRLRLFNTFNGAEISLPSDDILMCYNKVILFRDLPGGRPFLMISGFEKIEVLILSGDYEWRPSKRRVGFKDIISHHGRLLSVDGQGRIFVWEIPSTLMQDYTPDPRMIFEAPEIEKSRRNPPNNVIVRYYLLAAPWGDLLLVQRKDEFIPDKSVPTKFTVFRVDLLNRTLEKTTSLQGHTMIWGRQHHCLVSADLHPALLPDSIFFFKPACRVTVSHRSVILPTEVYDLTRHTFLPFPPVLKPPVLGNMTCTWITSP